MSRTCILVAEDDANIRRGLIDALESEGYRVVPAKDGREALRAYEAGGINLLLLDIMMPGHSGYDVCREVRRKDRRVPIILLTAKGEEIDKVVGLELGADDYICKPFGVRELLARLAAVLRRSAPAVSPPPDRPEAFDLGPCRVDVRRYTLTREGRTVSLTAREMRLLEEFHLHPGEVLTRDDLLNRVWGVEYLGTTRTLDQHIAQLRKKVEADPSSPVLIVTVHGIGYRYDMP